MRPDIWLPIFVDALPLYIVAEEQALLRVRKTERREKYLGPPQSRVPGGGGRGSKKKEKKIYPGNQQDRFGGHVIVMR